MCLGHLGDGEPSTETISRSFGDGKPSFEAPPGRTAGDCVRAPNCVQALDIMGFRIHEGGVLSCRILDREGVELQGFGREAPETLRPAPKALA